MVMGWYRLSAVAVRRSGARAACRVTRRRRECRHVGGAERARLEDRTRCRLTPPPSPPVPKGRFWRLSWHADGADRPPPNDSAADESPTSTELGRRYSRRAPAAARVCLLGVCTLMCASGRSGCTRPSFFWHSIATDCNDNDNGHFDDYQNAYMVIIIIIVSIYVIILTGWLLLCKTTLISSVLYIFIVSSISLWFAIKLVFTLYVATVVLLTHYNSHFAITIVHRFAVIAYHTQPWRRRTTTTTRYDLVSVRRWHRHWR